MKRHKHLSSGNHKNIYMFQQVASQRKKSYLKKFCRYRKKQGNERTALKIFRIKLKMANTLSVMTNVLRNVVSKQRIRYKEKGFNLDLAYICDNIIAMGYPADNIESFYRNRIEDVYKFFEENYHDHYKIYNLCLERSYDVNKFHGRVASYPFEDHNPPTIELIQKFCYDVDCWLKSDPSNVAAIHCKAGKGRTGTMICCYLLYSGIQPTAEDALACYDEKRTKDRKGVTIPSQRRYVQYFSKLIQSGMPYKRRSLQFCEIRFAGAYLLHNQGVVNCSISLLHDITTLKVQTLQTHTIDFRKSMTLEINNPALTVTGDIKVELTHKSSRKKIFHFWFNTYFVCDTADTEDNGEHRKFVYTLHKTEIDDAHKDKEHKCFSEDFKVQVVFLPVKSEEKHSTDINILQQSGSTVHSEVSQGSSCTQNNSILSQDSSKSSSLNYICDQKTSSSTSACSFSANKSSRFIGEGAQGNRSEGLEVSFAVLENVQGNKANTPTSGRIINEEMTNERTKKSNASIPTFSYPIQLLKSPFADLTPSFYQSQNYPILQNHFQLGAKKNCMRKQQLCIQNPNEDLQNPSLNASKSIRSSSKKYADSVKSNCLNRHATETSDNCNSNECSSSSISSHSTSSAAGDNEEDWESGESSLKPIANNKALFSTSASNLNTHFRLNFYNSSSCIENKVGDDDDDHNDKRLYLNGIDDKTQINFNSSNLEQTCDCCRSTDSTGIMCKPFLENPDLISSEQSEENNKLKAPIAAAAANYNKPILNKMSCKLYSNASISKPMLEHEAVCSLTLHCSGSSGVAPTSKQKLKFKLKKNKMKLSQKFQWFQNYFRNDPIDFCENFVQQTTVMRRNSNCSVTNRSGKVSSAPPPTQLGCFPKLSSVLPSYVGKPMHSEMFAEQVKPKPAASLSRLDNFDFYSSICDKQLSFSNSPSKSPRSLAEMVLTSDSSFISAKSKDLVVVAAKSEKTNVTGFNAAAQESTVDANKQNCNLGPQMAASVDYWKNSNSKDTEVCNSPQDLLSDDSMLFPFEFQNFQNELDKLDKSKNFSKQQAINIEKMSETNNKTGYDTVLNLVFVKEINKTDLSYNNQHIPTEKIMSSKKNINSKCKGMRMQVGSGSVVSDSSNSSSSGFHSSECCATCSGSVCSCNPFALDLERNSAIKQLTDEDCNENFYESSKSDLTKSNVNIINRDKDVIDVLESKHKQFVDF